MYTPRYFIQKSHINCIQTIMRLSQKNPDSLSECLVTVTWHNFDCFSLSHPMWKTGYKVAQHCVARHSHDNASVLSHDIQEIIVWQTLDSIWIVPRHVTITRQPRDNVAMSPKRLSTVMLGLSIISQQLRHTVMWLSQNFVSLCAWGLKDTNQ